MEEETPDQIKDYEKNKKLITALKEKEIKLRQELEGLNGDERKLINERAILDAKISRETEDFEEAKKEGNVISEEGLHIRCKEAIDFFLREIPKDFQQKYTSMTIRIEYNRMNINKTILDENMTFEKLKEETKLQFDKEKDEFYFTDEKGNIFLDELNVIRSLFPLSEVKLEKYEPVIRVITRNLEKEKKEKFVSVPGKENDNSSLAKREMLKRLKVFIVQNSLKIFHLFIFVLFLALWIDSCIEFRHGKEYQIFNHLINRTRMLELTNSTPSSFLQDFKKNVASILNFPSEEEVDNGKIYIKSTASTMSNKQLYYIRLIQTRSSANLNCTNDRITFNTSALCLGRYDPIQTAMTFANQTYPYTRKENSKEIFGIFQSYDNSGFIEDVPIQDYTQFYTKMNELIANNWIDSNTMSIIVISNLYNINLDLIMIVRLLYENLNNKFHYTKDFQIFDKSMQQQGSMWISLVFSLVCIILMIRTLRNEVQKEIPYLIMNHRNRWEKFIYQTKIWIKNTKLNYRLPDIFEAISFCNFAFYFSLIAIRMSYLKETSSLNIYVTRFTDLEKSSQTYELVTYLNCLSILVFMLSVINHINYLSDDFKQITDAIKKYIWNILTFSLSFTLIFVIISFFVSLFLYGDLEVPYYKNSYFIFIKVLQSFYRGTSDNVDYDDRIGSTAIVTNSKEYNPLLGINMPPYRSIHKHSGDTGYIIYSILFFFVANIIIKVAHSAYFLIAYREINVRNMLANKKAKTE